MLSSGMQAAVVVVRGGRLFLVTAYVFPSSLILPTLMMEAIRSS
jgi:hypothetical protein